MILDCVSWATIKQFRDSSPLVTETVVGFNDDSVLLGRPVGFPDLGAEVVEPSFSALLSDTTLAISQYRPNTRVGTSFNVPECVTQW